MSDTDLCYYSSRDIKEFALSARAIRENTRCATDSQLGKCKIAFEKIQTILNKSNLKVTEHEEVKEALELLNGLFN